MNSINSLVDNKYHLTGSQSIGWAIRNESGNRVCTTFIPYEHVSYILNMANNHSLDDMDIAVLITNRELTLINKKGLAE
jgi:hypothetical protein